MACAFMCLFVYELVCLHVCVGRLCVYLFV